MNEEIIKVGKMRCECSNAMFDGDGNPEQIFIWKVLNERYHVQSYFTSNLYA